MSRQPLSTILVFLVFLSLNVVADSKEPCRPPVLPVSDYNFLRFVEYFGDSGTAKKATVGDNFSLQCESGVLEVQPGSEIRFNSEAMPKEIYAENSSFAQRGVKTSPKLGAKIALSDLGYLVEIEDTEAFSYTLGSQQQINLAGKLEFYEDGNLLSAEAASRGQISIFGDSIRFAEGDGLYFTPYRTLISESTLKRVKGDWTLSSSQGNLKLSADYNRYGELELFLLRGDARVLHPDICCKSMIQPLSAKRFYLSDTDFVSFDLKGAIYKEVGEESVREEFPIPVVLSQIGKSLILDVDGSSLRFERDNLIDVAISRLFALGQGFVSLVLFLVGAFFVIVIFGGWLAGLSSVKFKVDRRYTKQGVIRGGGDRLLFVLFLGVVAIAIPIAAYALILEWLQISGPGAYFSFFFF